MAPRPFSCARTISGERHPAGRFSAVAHPIEVAAKPGNRPKFFLDCGLQPYFGAPGTFPVNNLRKSPDGKNDEWIVYWERRIFTLTF
jgi:hypothetical protein